jgi:hypothetical protein
MYDFNNVQGIPTDYELDAMFFTYSYLKPCIYIPEGLNVYRKNSPIIQCATPTGVELRRFGNIFL